MKKKPDIVDVRELTPEYLQAAFDAMRPEDQIIVGRQIHILIKAVKEKGKVLRVHFGPGQAMEVLAKVGICVFRK